MTEADLTRKTDAASVTVTAALLNGLEHCGKPRLSFTLVLDTHSVDLTGIDLPASARVDTSDGQAVAAGFAWAGGDESSHHRDGTLSVAAPSLAAADWLRLTVKNVAGVDRTFEWGKTVLAHDLP